MNRVQTHWRQRCNPLTKSLLRSRRYRRRKTTNENQDVMMITDKGTLIRIGVKREVEYSRKSNTRR